MKKTIAIDHAFSDFYVADCYGALFLSDDRKIIITGMTFVSHMHANVV